MKSQAAPITEAERGVNSEPQKFFNRNYLLLFQGQFVSRIGTQLFLFAMIIWVTETFNSTSLVGLLGMASGIPPVILGAFAGVFADRYSRKSIIVWSDVLNGVTIILLSVLFYFFPENRSIIFIGLLVVSVTSATITSFFMPAIGAALPDIVPKDKIPAANSLGQFSRQISRLIGQGLGAQILAWLGAPLLTLINGLTFIFSAFSESFIQIPQKIPEKAKTFKDQFRDFTRDIKEGFHYIWSRKGLRHLVFISIFISFFSAPVMILLPFFVRDYLGVSFQWFGYMLIIFGLGTTIGYAVVGIFKLKGSTRKNLVIIFTVFEALSTVMLAFCHNQYQAMAVMFLQGFFSGFVMVNITSLVQMTTPSEIRGRVFGVVTTITGSIAPLGMGLGGVIADLLDQNIPLLFVILGSIIILLVVLISLSPHYQRFLSYRSKWEEEEEMKTSGVFYKIRYLQPGELGIDEEK
ncbi:MFS transporter [Calditrichota bacterium GD2]